MAIISGQIVLGGGWLKSRTRGVVIAEVLSRFFPRYAPKPPCCPPNTTSATTAVEEQGINLSWANGVTDLSCTTELWWSPDNVTFTLVTTLPLSTLTYKHITGFFGTTFYYKFRHSNVTDFGPFCATLTATSQVDYPNAPPTSLSIANTARPGGETALALTWVNGDATCQTQVTRDGTLIATMGAGVTTFTDTGLLASTTHSYVVKHIKSGVLSAASNTASGTTLVDGPDAPPFSPSAVGGSGIAGQRMVTAGWSNGDTSAQTEIWRSPDGSTYALLVTVGTGTAAYADDTGAYGTTFWYKMRHTKNSVVSSFTTAVSAVSGPDIPDANPSSCAVTVPGAPTGATALNVSWVNGDASCQTHIYRGASLVGTAAAGATSFQDTGLTENTTYSYHVAHVKSSVESGSSNTASATTIDIPNAPPTSLTATQGTGVPGQAIINLAWTNGDVTAQTVVLVSTDAGSTYSTLVTLTPGTASYAHNVGAFNVRRDYLVYHTKSGVNSATSNAAHANSGLDIPDAPPTSLAASPASAPTGETTLNLSWVNGDASCQTNVYRGGVLLTTVGAGVTSFTNSGLSANTSYGYEVRHTKSGVESTGSTATGTTLVDGPDAAPTACAATFGGNANDIVTWTNGDASCSTEVYRGGAFIGSVGAGVATLTDSGVAASTTYTYNVRHVKNGVASGFSNTTSVTTPAVPPAPTVSSVTSTATRTPTVSLTLGDAGATTTIERSTNGAGFGTAVTLAAGVASWTDTVAAPTSATVSYRAYHQHNGYTSGYSNTGSVTTPGQSLASLRLGGNVAYGPEDPTNPAFANPRHNIVEGWFRPFSTGIFFGFCANAYGETNPDNPQVSGWFLYRLSTGAIGMRYKDGFGGTHTAAVTSAAGVFPTGVWTHLRVSVFSLYVNGTLTLAPANDGVNGGFLTLGGLVGGSLDDGFADNNFPNPDGYGNCPVDVDEFRIWTIQDYNSTGAGHMNDQILSGPSGGLVAYTFDNTMAPSGAADFASMLLTSGSPVYVDGAI